MTQPPTVSQDDDVKSTLLKLNARAWGIALGLLFGLGLALATLVLVFRGGTEVGPHLGLISIFLPGYSVSVVGALIGFAYMFVIGYAIGRLIGLIYNSLARSG